VKNITHPIHPWMGTMFFYLKFMEDSEKCKSLVIKGTTKKEKIIHKTTLLQEKIHTPAPDQKSYSTR